MDKHIMRNRVLCLALVIGVSGCGGTKDSSTGQPVTLSSWSAYCNSTDPEIVKTVDVVLQSLTHDRQSCATVPVDQITKLRLGPRGESGSLTNLRPLWMFIHLQTLGFWRCLDTRVNQPDFFSGIEKLAALTTLGLEGAGLSTIPQAIHNLHLEKLELSFNEGLARSRALAGIERFKNLKELDLAHIGFPVLPPEIGSLELEVLDLSGSNFAQPNALHAIAKPSSLKELDLSKSNIASLPDGIFQKNLLDLDLSYNQLNGIPAALKNATQLKVLNLSGITNKWFYETDTDGIHSGPGITNPDFDHASLAVLGKLEHLETLNLSHVDLPSLPSEWGKLKGSLISLDLSWTSVKTADSLATIGGLIHLMHLNLSNMKIDGKSDALLALPSEMAGLIALRTLDVSGNPALVWTVPKELTFLRTLNADLEATITIPKELGELSTRFQKEKHRREAEREAQKKRDEERVKEEDKRHERQVEESQRQK